MLRGGARQPSWWSSGWIAKDISIFALDATTPEPTALKDCFVQRRVYDVSNDGAVLLQNNDAAYRASDCVAQQPD